jgi:hypothetical protein
MHGPINVKCPNNTSKWQIGFNSAFKGLILVGATIFVSSENHEITYVNILCKEDAEFLVLTLW